MKAKDFCRGLNKTLCEKAKACDPEFYGEVADCIDSLNAEHCLDVTGFTCSNAKTAARGCIAGIQSLTCDQFMDPTVTDADVPGCVAMACPEDGSSGGSGSGGGGAMSCDCSTVSQDCSITYDGMGNPTEHCTCFPSCCC